MRDLLVKAGSWWREAGGALALARVVAVRGSSPRPLGAAMLIGSDGRFTGSVSGGCVEGEVIRVAGEVLADGTARLLRVTGDADPLTDIALGCGGDETIFIEPLTGADGLLPVFQALLVVLADDAPATLLTSLTTRPWHRVLDADGAVAYEEPAAVEGGEIFTHVFPTRPHLVIVGADAIGQAVQAQAITLGWRTTVIDPRPAWLTPARFAETRIVAFPGEALAQLTLTAETAIAVLSHDPKLDEPALIAALASPASYIGALGSRTAHAARVERLRASGLSSEDIERIYAPIGLDLGGHTPQEIALSILAEIVAARNGRGGQALRTGTGSIHAVSAPMCEPVGERT
ncbi:MAG TPA: XdhC family protein [Ktedonobacterales bacterium]